MNTTTGVERFGVRREQSILISIPGGEKLPAAVCSLAVDGTSLEIFSRLHRPLREIAFSPEAVQTFSEEHQGVLLEQDHVTMILCEVSPGTFEVATFEMDDSWRLESSRYPIDHSNEWRADDWHQVVLPGSLFS